MYLNTCLAVLLVFLPVTLIFADPGDLKHRPKPKNITERDQLRGEIKEDFSAQLSLEQVYGISEQEYQKSNESKEKDPSEYRKLINNEHYAWFQPFGMRGSVIYQQGKWIYPYLVEGLTEIEKWDNVIYPPKMTDVGAIHVNYSDVKVRLLHHVNRLYIQKNYDQFFNRSNFFYSYSDDEKNINRIVSTNNIKDIQKLQKRLLKQYCFENKLSIYCKNVMKNTPK